MTLQDNQRFTDLGYQDMLIVKVSATASPPRPSLSFFFKEMGTGNDDISSQKRILKIEKSVKILIYTDADSCELHLMTQFL
jgi:hypothetical protein